MKLYNQFHTIQHHLALTFEKTTIYLDVFEHTLESGIDVGQGITVGPGKFVKKNKRRALNKRRA